MLESIHIENVALIKKLDISFESGFTAFTGETGAGKSIIIDSIGIICGARAPKELIRNGSDYALVEAVFSGLSGNNAQRAENLGAAPDEDGYLYLSRKITSDGKSICRVGGKQVPTSVLRELSSFLINIHGQHDNQDLLKKDKHISILDAYAGCTDEVNNYRRIFEEYKQLKKEYDGIHTDEAEKERTIEMLKFQIDEIASLKLKPDEEDTLTAEKKRLSNIEKIAQNANTAYDLLFASNISATESVDKAITCLNNLSKMLDGIDDYTERLENARSEIYDIAEYMHDIAGDSAENPSSALDRIEQRLYDIFKLKRKYGPTVQDILDFKEKAAERLNNLELSDERASELLKKLSSAKDELTKSAVSLSQAREKAAEKLKNEIEKEFEFLEMSKTGFLVSLNRKDFSEDGADDVEFLVKTNSGQPYSPLSKTASGGELSRIMLAIKSVIAKKDGVETVIFDEVDTGISGKTSRRIGIKLLQTSHDSQVMCVTHSAQIASLANTHYLVSKQDGETGTVTTVKKLGSEERVNEVARIISGIDVTETAKSAALELIEEAKKYNIHDTGEKR